MINKKGLVVLSFVFTLLLLLPALCFAQDKDERWSSSYALEANGQYEQAAALIVPELDHGDDSEYALLRYGWLNYLQGNYTDSIRAYTKAMERNKRSFDANLGLMLPLMAQKRWQEASRYARQVLDKSPWNYTAHLNLIICEEGLRKWQTMETHAGQVAAYYPSDATVLVYLARAYSWEGKKEEAKIAYKRVLIRYPEHVEATRFLAD